MLVAQAGLRPVKGQERGSKTRHMICSSRLLDATCVSTVLTVKAAVERPLLATVKFVHLQMLEHPSRMVGT